MTYARVWRGVWYAALVVGVGLACLEWSPQFVGLAVALVSFFVGAGLVLGHTSAPRPDAAANARWRHRLVPRSVVTGAALVSLVALVAVSPGLAPVVLAAVAVSAPDPLRRRVGRRVRRLLGPDARGLPRRPRRPVPPPSASVVVADLDDHELCALWRRTFWELQDHRTPDELHRMIAVRRECLDELERRNPAAMRAWLSSGAPASTGPERYWAPGAPEDDADAA